VMIIILFQEMGETVYETLKLVIHVLVAILLLWILARRSVATE
jgi:hypothetical protein